MKFIKSVLIVFLLSAVSLNFGGCIIIPKSMHYDEIELGSVDSIEIYDNRDAEHREHYFWETEDSVYTLSEEENERFLKELADIKFTDVIVITLAAVDPSFSFGDWAVRINYADGGYQFISDGGYGVTFDKDGNLTDSNHFSCEDEEWDELVLKYLPEELA
ncbi:MAG: hypothetical protein IJB49_08390 [Clostridia bacterium]|nr:hypothetical protein [Clostridia bacterium]